LIRLGDDDAASAARWLSADSRTSCVSRCGETGTVVHVDKGVRYVVNGTALQPGYWCVRNAPNCDFKTQMAVATASGVPTCLSLFPNLADPCTDPSGLKVAKFQDLEPDAPYASETDADRFACIEPGLDAMGNTYVPQTVNPLRLVSNPCTKEIVSATSYVQLRTTSTGGYECDCGDYSQSRVRNKIDGDKSTTCTSCFNALTRAGYPCVKFNSPLGQLGKLPVCNPTKFADETVPCMSRSVDMAVYEPLLSDLFVSAQGYT